MTMFADLMTVLGGSAGILVLVIMAAASPLPHQRRPAATPPTPALPPAPETLPAGVVPAQRDRRGSAHVTRRVATRSL